ncbi:MAG TPA: S8 family peptidase [Vicinamibacterales bacterium]|nr:S8 family peptidase [Vicinamibacterales bacterium]
MAKRRPPRPRPSANQRSGQPGRERKQAPLASDALPARERLHRDMMRSTVTEPLLTKVLAARTASFDVIISLNELFEHGIQAALQEVERRAKQWGVTGWSSTSHYVFARLSGEQILALAAEARTQMAHDQRGAVVYRIWEDSDVETTLTRTLATIKADAAQRAFRALGHGIVWAVLDSGIEKSHPHFTSPPGQAEAVDTLTPPDPLEHLDFTPDGLDAAGNPTTTRASTDRFGHGTHVAGIISGSWESKDGKPQAVVGTEVRDESADGAAAVLQSLSRISGVAPLCTLVSLKVVADTTLTGAVQQRAGQGKVSWLLRAIDKIQEWNQHGKRLLIHGVNMSLGYDFDARWFGCGQSPLCVEVNRLVKSGVVVVVSAGNAGYPTFVVAGGRTESRYAETSIMDPGNAELAITVGATHRDSPHLYGVSYFSSRGPTGDGRLKPDLLAPGERIWSCAAGLEAQRYAGMKDAKGRAVRVLYLEQTGTSMAAPHVSGAIAAFLSVRREFIGQPERVKEIVLRTAVDLRRERYVQGAGLLDLMKMLQLV